MKEEKNSLASLYVTGKISIVLLETFSLDFFCCFLGSKKEDF